MSDQHVRDSYFYMDKEGNIRSKSHEFTLMVNGKKIQTKQYDLSKMYGSNMYRTKVDFDKKNISLIVLIEIVDIKYERLQKKLSIKVKQNLQKEKKRESNENWQFETSPITLKRGPSHGDEPGIVYKKSETLNNT